jgi:hypothetical protein
LIAGAERRPLERELVFGSVVSIGMTLFAVSCLEVAPGLAQHALDARSDALGELLDIMLSGLAERQKLELALLCVAQPRSKMPQSRYACTSRITNFGSPPSCSACSTNAGQCARSVRCSTVSSGCRRA